MNPAHKTKPTKIERTNPAGAELIGEAIAADASAGIAAATKEMKAKRSLMTIAQTKIGITVVLSKDECVKLGMPSTTLARDAVKHVRAMLGLEARR